MSKDFSDWQFWVVSAIALGALLYLLRGVIPDGWSPFRRKKPGIAASLTIGGKAMPKKPRKRPGSK